MAAKTPNPSLKPTVSGMRPWPRGAVVDLAPHGQGRTPPPSLSSNVRLHLMPNALALVAFFAAAVSQIALLGAVAFHRAGGWGNEGLAFGIFCLLASIPLGLIGASVLRAPRKRLSVGACAWFLTTLSLGLLFTYLALSQYGHGTPLILLMGYVLQSIAAVTTWREFRSAA